MTDLPQHVKRIVTAPPPFPTLAQLPPNRVLSAVLEDDEEIEWVWSTTTDGVSYVSGYTILKQGPHG
jgi:hypothetical protein